MAESTDVVANTVPAPATLTIDTLAPLKQELLLAIDGSDSVRFDMSNVTSCDTAGIQLVLSAALYARGRQHLFIIDNPTKAVFVATQRCGVNIELLFHNVA